MSELTEVAKGTVVEEPTPRPSDAEWFVATGYAWTRETTEIVRYALDWSRWEDTRRSLGCPEP